MNAFREQRRTYALSRYRDDKRSGAGEQGSLRSNKLYVLTSVMLQRTASLEAEQQQKHETIEMLLL